jgi:hypothetical protein
VKELGWDRLSGQMEGFYRRALGPSTANEASRS